MTALRSSSTLRNTDGLSPKDWHKYVSGRSFLATITGRLLLSRFQRGLSPSSNLVSTERGIRVQMILPVYLFSVPTRLVGTTRLLTGRGSCAEAVSTWAMTHSTHPFFYSK